MSPRSRSKVSLPRIAAPAVTFHDRAVLTQRHPHFLHWNEAVLAALTSSHDALPLSALNAYVKEQAPNLLTHNHHWEAKIRQVVQRLRDKGGFEQSQ